MGSFGRTVTGQTGNPIEVIADGRTDGFKTAGVTIDWSTVTAVSGSDATLLDGTVVKVGDKYIRYGTVLDVITASGKYGPVNTAGSDGREAMARGQSYILNRTVVMSEIGSDHPPVFDAGTVFLDRLLTNEAVGSAGNPTLANVLTAFPGLIIVRD
jgi:hypothetical protein